VWSRDTGGANQPARRAVPPDRGGRTVRWSVAPCPHMSDAAMEGFVLVWLAPGRVRDQTGSAGLERYASSAARTAASRAIALLRVSVSSSVGTLSATIPAPACA
jgi:hypothetical protein